MDGYLINGRGSGRVEAAVQLGEDAAAAGLAWLRERLGPFLGQPVGGRRVHDGAPMAEGARAIAVGGEQSGQELEVQAVVVGTHLRARLAARAMHGSLAPAWRRVAHPPVAHRPVGDVTSKDAGEGEHVEPRGSELDELREAREPMRGGLRCGP